MEEVTSNGKCAFCSNSCKYTCPQCSCKYCSLQCYKSQAHLYCSENFYKELVMKELESSHSSTDEKKKMVDILQRINQDNAEDDVLDSDDEESLPDIMERLEGVNLDDADDVWNHLSHDEKVEFEQLVRSGDVSNIIPEFTPWWNKRYEKKVECHEEYLANQEQYMLLCPKIVKPRSSLIIKKCNTSPCVQWNIVNVLAAYVYTIQYYIGEHKSNPIEATTMIRSLSSNLNNNENFDSKTLAIESVAVKVVNDLGITSSVKSVKLMKDDISCVLEGPTDTNCRYYSLAALSDIFCLFDAALFHKGVNAGIANKGEFTNRFVESVTTKLDKKSVRLNMKKIEYYLAWMAADG